MDNKRVFLYIDKNGNYQGFFVEGISSHIPSEAFEITQEQYVKLLDGLNSDKLIYLDDDGKPQLRDRLTYWDAKKKKWMPDTEAIAKEAKERLNRQAETQLMYTDTWGLVDRCADSPQEHVTIMQEYRKKLRAVIRGELDKLPELPKI